ncbi:alkaline phosphatase D family protein [Paraglaciecola aquimarina]|uniref:Alkaline phosphatase D family protein n=1 Tax=Paraglaciecola aquimarina TaxID=1235557 RepID=A0ABU3SW83_9ALTE|nr:alkaline phosphatase D family protein [Paraglaciecola aquimarina]MDU0354264.1 alkaline phosphatase D family protein [Paraglaciecola aquimarina]
MFKTISSRLCDTFANRLYLCLLCIGLLSINVASANTQVSPQHYKIIFGSCLHQDKAQPIWQAINQEQADLFVLLGDNVYGDTEDMKALEAKYAKQWQKPGMQKMLANTPLIGIWDDHDFGENDAGVEYPQKEASRQIMLDYFNEPADSIRRTRKDGIYTSYIFGKAPMRIQIILPDLRWNRTKLNSVGKLSYMTNKAPKNLGPYEPSEEPSASMLGDTQWQWLEQQLQQPADVRIMASSLQLLPEFTGWESWANFPKERQRFLDLLDKYQVYNLVVVSGDTHWSELSQVTRKNQQPLWEMTASGLTEEWKNVSPNKHRVGDSYSQANYGVIDIKVTGKTQLEMSIKDVEGAVKMQTSLTL